MSIFDDIAGYTSRKPLRDGDVIMYGGARFMIKGVHIRAGTTEWRATLQRVETTQAYGVGTRAGIEAAADFLRQWDETLAPLVNGYRVSELVLGKFNAMRGKPRKMRKAKKPRR